LINGEAGGRKEREAARRRMSSSEFRARGKDSLPWPARFGRRLASGGWAFVQFVLVLWATLAIYYSNLPWPAVRIALAVAFAAFSVWALWLTPKRGMGLVFAALLIAVIVWELSIPPHQDRRWRTDVAVLPRATVEGDRVRITGVRDFTWRGRQDFTVRYEEREVSLSHLASVDLFISYWGAERGPVAHTFLSFNFDNAAPISISIEARPEADEGYAPLASMFKQFELIYIVGEERDIVGVRTTHRGEAVHIYRIRAPAEAVRQLFLIYMTRINELADRPEWYSLLKSNCTLNIVRYARVAGWAAGFDPRQYLNGWVDSYLYGEGLLNSALPFDALRNRSRIHETVTPGESASLFSQRIRSSTEQ
jgi:hypothetical protein